MKNKAENVASGRVDAESRGHSLLTSKLYTPAAHLRYLFRVSEYQPSTNVPISQTYRRFFDRLILSLFGWLSQESAGLKGDWIIILTE